MIELKLAQRLKIFAKLFLSSAQHMLLCDAVTVLGSCEECFLGVGLGIVEGDYSQKLFFVCREILKNELCSISNQSHVRKLLLL